MERVMIIANHESTIYNFRREIVSALVEKGYEVIVCLPIGNFSEEFLKLGCKLADIKVSRHGTNVFQDIMFMLNCRKLIAEYKPDVVLTYTVKPNIYGSIACRITKTPCINNVTGLGSVLQSKSPLAKLVLMLQRYAYKTSDCVFLQNTDNYEHLKKHKVITDKTHCRILPGSGVNLNLHTYAEFPKETEPVRFIMVSRIRKDKGYEEYFNAAEHIKRKYPDVEFHVVGGYEEDEWKNKVIDLTKRGIIIYHGKKTQEEVHQIISCCSCLVHPSYHEGMANVLLEAAAAGRCVVATDIPGCRETFDEGISGYGCKVRDTESLCSAIEKVISDSYEKRIEMGKAGRAKMEKEFDRNFVVNMYMEEINEINDRKKR